MRTMLLPSALPCDPRPSLKRFGRYSGRDAIQSPHPRSLLSPPFEQAQAHFASGLQSTSRALHSLLGIQPPSASPNLVAAASTAAAAANNRQQRTCSANPSLHADARIKKRPPIPMRRGCKRRRSDAFESDDEGDNNNNSESPADGASAEASDGAGSSAGRALPSTPKRRRRAAPPNLPFGLERSDFWDLLGRSEKRGRTPRRSETAPPSPAAAAALPADAIMAHDGEITPKGPSLAAPPPSQQGAGQGELQELQEQEDEEGREDEADAWSDEDDRLLVDMVLDKLRLSRREWDECARMLGTDQRSLGRRWQYLVDEGQVGLRFRRSNGRKMRGDVRALWA